MALLPQQVELTKSVIAGMAAAMDTFQRRSGLGIRKRVGRESFGRLEGRVLQRNWLERSACHH